jgi:hypothetical protein
MLIYLDNAWAEIKSKRSTIPHCQLVYSAVIVRSGNNSSIRL